MTSPAPIQPATSIHLSRAADIIRGGGVIVYPTETVYGLGANPFDPNALNRIFCIKQRDLGKAVILLIRGEDDLDRLAAEVPPTAHYLMEAFWPGPLTLVFKAAPDLPQGLLGTSSTIALRTSDAPIAQDLLARVGGPVTSTSANLSGHPPARSAIEAASRLSDRVDLILDGGTLPDARPSTIVNVALEKASIIRVGRISKEAIHRVMNI